MRALIGLGNPGRDYRFTRHNIGFLFLDYLQSKFNIPFCPGRGDYYFCETAFAGQKVLLVKPVTYINRSGLAVMQVMEQFELLKRDLLIIYDDFALPFADIRFRAKGSSAGHNGLKSIIYNLESEIFQRLKIGIGSPADNSIDHVLSKFTADEEKELIAIFERSFEAVKYWIEHGIDLTMNKFNQRGLDSSLKAI